MNPLYNFAMRAFGTGIRIAALRDEKVKKLRDGQRDSLEYLRAKLVAGEKYIWFHAASSGEFEQGRPMIEMIKRNYPDSRILLTFFSPSGYEVKKNFPLVDAVCYLPLDTPGNAARFLDIVNPSVAIFIKYEFWGNFLQQLRRRGVPTYIISAIFRPSQAFFKPWGGMMQSMLKCYTRIYVQDERSKALLAGIGIDNVTVAGDTRFDRVTDIMKGCKEIPEIKMMKERGGVMMVAGSTWEPDEANIIPYFNSHPGLKLIIAPHEVKPERIAAIESAITRKVYRLSSLTVEEAAVADCVIVDCYGKLSSIYTYGDIGYIGGGFGVGIHNINEAAVYGMPVIFGPNYRKFKEAIEMIAVGGAFTYRTGEEFDAIMGKLLSDPAFLESSGRKAADYVKHNLGATACIYADLDNVIAPNKD